MPAVLAPAVEEDERRCDIGYAVPMSGALSRAVERVLARQDPSAVHSWLTRLVILAIIVFANAVLYGFFGVIGAVAFYLLFVELAGVDMRWMYAPIVIALVLGLRTSFSMSVDYWRNYGRG